MIALTVTIVVLFAVGVHKNSQIDGLRDHGVRAVDTVGACTGLLGGSGSNGAGYSCWGTYTVDGRSYRENIPGNSLYPTGSKLTIVADGEQPGLMTTVSELRSEHASAEVFLVPAILLAALAALAAVLLWKSVQARRARPGGGA